MQVLQATLKRRVPSLLPSHHPHTAASFCERANRVSTTRPMDSTTSSVTGYTPSCAATSNTSRQPAPWSSVPLNFLSRIICDSLVSTFSTGREMSEATWEISTREKGSIRRTRFCSSSVSYSDARCVAMSGSPTSSASYADSAPWNAARERSWYALATAFMASTPRPVYLSPALDEMMPGTSPASFIMILHSSMYLSRSSALGSPSDEDCSKASKKYEKPVL
mmetsp:Transcript_23598/g.60309  ORF Transcript_23598/g.60309 Transcript_23598/m.60309 type:complete len:222 (-) Transcript_23598:362-1027(-)